MRSVRWKSSVRKGINKAMDVKIEASWKEALEEELRIGVGLDFLYKQARVL